MKYSSFPHYCIMHILLMARHCLFSLLPLSTSRCLFLFSLSLPLLSLSSSSLSLSRERNAGHTASNRRGKLKISPEQHCDFTAEDLRDLGEIGRGAYGLRQQHGPQTHRPDQWPSRWAADWSLTLINPPESTINQVIIQTLKDNWAEFHSSKQ